MNPSIKLLSLLAISSLIGAVSVTAQNANPGNLNPGQSQAIRSGNPAAIKAQLKAQGVDVSDPVALAAALETMIISATAGATPEEAAVIINSIADGLTVAATELRLELPGNTLSVAAASAAAVQAVSTAAQAAGATLGVSSANVSAAVNAGTSRGIQTVAASTDTDPADIQAAVEAQTDVVVDSTPDPSPIITTNAPGIPSDFFTGNDGSDGSENGGNDVDVDNDDKDEDEEDEEDDEDDGGNDGGDNDDDDNVISPES